MAAFDLVADRRADRGKAASRRLRREGKVPAVLYGAGKDTVNLELVHKDLYRQLDNEAFFSHILTVSFAGTKENVVVKALQRHPYRQQILHMDLLRVQMDEELTMNTPLHFLNEDKCAGAKKGGVVSHLMNDIEIICLPKDLPEYVEVDVAELDVGDTLTIGDLKMPSGVRLAALEHEGDPETPVVTVVMPRAEKEESEEDEEAELIGEEAVPRPAGEDEEDKGKED